MFLKSLIYYFHLLSMVVWIGGIIFFSFVGAPAIFKTLAKEDAARVVRAIFPTYYIIGTICGIIAIATTLLFGVSEYRPRQIKIGILIFMIILTLFSGLYILPKSRSIKTEINSTVEVETKAKLSKKFSQIHGLSMILNMIVLLGGLIVLYFITELA